MVLPQQLVRRIIDPEILIDALALNIGIVSVKVDGRMLKILHCHAVATKSARAVAVLLLQPVQIIAVQNKRFQLVPLVFQTDLHPAVEDILRSVSIHNARHRALLELLINGEAVDSAGDPAGP